MDGAKNTKYPETHPGARVDGGHDQLGALDVLLDIGVDVGERRRAVAVQDMPLLRHAERRLVEEEGGRVGGFVPPTHTQRRR